MRYLLFLVALCTGCNSVKKSISKTFEQSTLKHEFYLDSVDYRKNYFHLLEEQNSHRSESFHISFAPGVRDSGVNVFRIVDTGDITILDFGNNTPATIDYTKKQKQKNLKDSTIAAVDSVVTKQKVLTKESTAKEAMQKDKHTERVPWLLIVIVTILIAAAAYCFKRMTSF